LRKGAALNTLQIAEICIYRKYHSWWKMRFDLLK
jgi:hypothetical protein